MVQVFTDGPSKIKFHAAKLPARPHNFNISMHDKYLVSCPDPTPKS